MDYDLLRERLTGAFINREYQILYPDFRNMSNGVTMNLERTQYDIDPLFKNRVDKLVAGVLYIIQQVECPDLPLKLKIHEAKA